MSINSSIAQKTSIIALALLLIAGITAYLILTPPRKAPAYDGPRPQPALDGYAKTTASILINTSVANYDAWSKSAPLNDILPGANGIPSVTRTEMLNGKWDDPGARRRVVLSDGHYAAEEVIARDRPRLFRYEVWGYTNFAKLATDYAIGEFIAEDDHGKTRLTWTYAFHKRSSLTAGFLERFVNNTWAPYMQTVLQIMKTEAEKSDKT